jgi:hypothetical protein
MARKTHTLNRPQDIRESAPVSNRRPMPPAEALYLAQLHPDFLEATPPGTRQRIAVQIEEPSQSPHVVKIIHADSI